MEYEFMIRRFHHRIDKLKNQLREMDNDECNEMDLLYLFLHELRSSLNQHKKRPLSSYYTAYFFEYEVFGEMGSEVGVYVRYNGDDIMRIAIDTDDLSRRHIVRTNTTPMANAITVFAGRYTHRTFPFIRALQSIADMYHDYYQHTRQIGIVDIYTFLARGRKPIEIALHRANIKGVEKRIKAHCREHVAEYPDMVVKDLL